MTDTSLYIIVCHPAIIPTDTIHKILPKYNNLNWMTHWDPDLPKFLKKNALLWSRQKTTASSVLVIDDADSISVHGFSSILGLLEQGFSRPIILIVSNLQKIPRSLYNRSEVIFVSDIPKEMEGWQDENPELDDHYNWERVLRM